MMAPELLSYSLLLLLLATALLASPYFKNLVDIDMSGVDLSGVDLSVVDVTGTELPDSEQADDNSALLSWSSSSLLTNLSPDHEPTEVQALLSSDRPRSTKEVIIRLRYMLAVRTARAQLMASMRQLALQQNGAVIAS
jgi:hypothetical protein